MTLGQALPLPTVAPYPLAYYNPLVGGAPAADRVCWSAGAKAWTRSQRYLNAQPDAVRQLIAIYFPLELNFQGMVAGYGHAVGDRRPIDYVVDYVNATQRHQTPGAVRGLTPELVVEINGVVYARVFRMRPPRTVL